MSNSNLEFVTNKIKDAALSSFHLNKAKFPQRLSNEELDAFEQLSKNENLVVQRVDKGNSVVLAYRDVCVIHMENIIRDQNNSQFVLKDQNLLILGEVFLKT